MACSVSTFLLEIGTEELPADFARLALPQLEQMVRSDLAEQRLGHGLIHCTSNRVMQRLAAFMGSFVLLVGLWTAWVISGL